MAATMADIGFGNSQVGLVHTLGHALGATFKLHGIFLPYVLQFYRRSADAKTILDRVSKKIDMETLIKRIFELMRKINIPERLSEIIDEKKLEKNLESLVMATLNDASLSMSPRVPDYEETKKIYEYAFYGKEIDF